MKKTKFAILIDEAGSEKLYLNRLVTLLREDYSFLKEECRLTREKQISKAKLGDIVVFGTHPRFDFTTISKGEFEEEYDHLDVFGLQAEFSKVKQQIKKYIRNRHNYKVDCDLSDFAYVYEDDDDYDENFVVVRKTRKVKPVKKVVVKVQKSKRKAQTVLDEVRVHYKYVQVGWDNYTIYFDAHDDEFIVVDGNVYFIERNSSGKGWLTV